MMIFMPVLLASLMLALLIAPFGVLTSWFRLSWFGETLAHSALLGVGLGLMFQISPLILVFITSLLLGYFVYVLMSQSYTQDMGQNFAIIAHGCMALGIILSSFYGKGFNIEAWLFGDILTLNYTMALIFALCMLMVWVIFLWKINQITLFAAHEDLAHVEGINTKAIRLVSMLSLAFVIALLVPYVGILLISALLVIPCAIARFFSHTPLRLIALSTFITIFCTLMGDLLAIMLNLPFGATIAATAFLLWILAIIIRFIAVR